MTALPSATRPHGLVHCAGCDVDYHPQLTGGRCPVCNEAAPGAPITDLTGRLRPFGLRCAWLFAAIAFVVLAHLLFTS